MTFPERHVLGDGTNVVLRYIQPSDRDELKRGFERLSSESRYRRFFAAVTHIDDKMLDYLCNVDGQDHVAIVAYTESLDLKEEHGVGVARFIRTKDDPRVAEIAITVADAQQKKGLGTLLLVTAVREARERGITHVRGETLPSNTAILSLLEAAGAHTRKTTDGTVVFDLAIGDDHPIRQLFGMAARQAKLFIRKISSST